MSSQQNIPPLLPELKDYRNEHSPQVRNPPFYADELNMGRDRQMCKGDFPLSRDMDEGLRRADCRKGEGYKQDHMDPNYHRAYGAKYDEDPRMCSPRAAPEPGAVFRYDSWEATPHSQNVEYYPDESAPYRTPYSKNDPLKEFYTEELRRGRVRSAGYQSSQRVYPDGSHQRSLERESGGPYNKAGGQGSSELESKGGSFPTPAESEQSHSHLFNIIRDYHHERRELYQEDAMSDPGTGRQVEITRSMSDIPEPFKRFLKGASNDEGNGKRKRKSRFSDATEQEVEMTTEM